MADDFEDDMSRRTRNVFYGLLALSQVAAVGIVTILVHFIANDFGGFKSLDSYHPILGVLGLVILQGESITLFRALRNFKKPMSKALHSALHFGALTCAIASFFIITRGRFTLPSSIHGAVGLFTIILFIAQYLIAFFVFLVQCSKPNIRAMLLPVHTFIGMTTFCLSCGVCLLELANFEFSVTTGVFAFSITFFAICLSFVATFSKFRRRAPAADPQLPASQS